MVIINSRNLKKGVHIGKRTLSLFLSALLCLQPLTVYAESDVEESIKTVEETIDEELESEDVEINDNDEITEETEVIEVEEDVEESIIEETEVIEDDKKEEINNFEQLEVNENELKIQEFIDFVNNLPLDVTEDNVEYVGEQVNIALDMYEKLVDLGLDDVEIFINQVYKLYNQIDVYYESSNFAKYKGTITIYGVPNEAIKVGPTYGNKTMVDLGTKTGSSWNNVSYTIPQVSQYFTLNDGWIIDYVTVAANSSGKRQPGASILLSMSGGSLVYYFKQVSTSKTFTLNYNANGGNDAPSTQTVTNTNTSHNFIISSKQPSKDGYKFLGWATTSSATVPTYFGGNPISVSSSTTLYAVWERMEQVTLTYDSNGGINAPLPQIVDKGGIITIKTQENMTKEGYEFVGWNTNKNAVMADWEPGDGLTLNSNTTLYAIWEKVTSTSYNVIYVDGLNESIFTNESYQSLLLDDITPPFSQIPQRKGYLDSNTFNEDEEEPSYTLKLPTKKSDSKYDYVFKGWIKPKTSLNDDDISYVASYDAIPKEYSYTITHEYYTDGIRDGFEGNSENNAEIDAIISETSITRNNIYNDNTYKYVSITPSTLQIQSMPSLNEFVLRYDRYSYKVIHKYLNEDGNLDGEVEETFYALEDDEIYASTLQQPLYNDALYPYKEDSGNLTVSTTKDSNVITITYQKEKQLPKETSYLIKWMDIDENELKSEAREGFIDDVKTPLDEDYELDGYTFVETQDNILSISLKEDESENILILHFERDKPIVSESPLPSESPIVSESPSPTPSNKPEVSESPEPSDSPKPSVLPTVSEEPSHLPIVEPSDSPEPSDEPIVSVQPSKSPVVSTKPSQQPSESPKPSETPTVSKSPTVSEKPSVSSMPTVSNTPNSTPTSNEDKVETPTPSTVDIPYTEVPKTSTPKKETTTIADPDMPLSATPTKTADELDFWIVLSISTFGLLLFLYNRKKY